MARTLEGAFGRRQSVRHRAILIALLALTMTLSAHLSPSDGQWIRHVIDNRLDGAAGLALADIDGDSRLDVVASGYEANVLQWYEAATGPLHVIDGNLIDAADLFVADLSGDGIPDVVATQYTGPIRWYEAPLWIMHPIDTLATGTQNVTAVDLDADGDLDVVAVARDAKDVRWYEAPSWTKRVIDPDLDGGRGLAVVDLDGDDTLDVVAAGMYSDDVVWYEGPTWTKHVIDSDFDGAIDVAIADIDGDGDLDVVAAGLYADKVILYRAPEWTKYEIDGWLDGARSVRVADLDGDSDLDVVATGMDGDLVVWYEAPSLTRHVIDPSLDGAYFLHIADVDADGDRDVVADAHYQDAVVWYENLQTTQVYPGSFSFEGLTRNYIVFVPKNVQPGMPLVVNLHGLTDNAVWQMDYSQMNRVADTAGFVVLYPDAIWPGFNSGLYYKDSPHTPPDVNDVGFISRLLDTMKARYDINVSRIYCCGYSNGGVMTERLARELGHRFAAGGIVASTRLDIPMTWNLLGPFPFLSCNGTEDPLVPYEGGSGSGGSPDRWSVQQTLDFWIQHNGCVVPGTTVSLPDIDPSDNSTVEKTTYVTGSGQRRVVHYKVINGGHSWPQGTKWFPVAVPTNRDININAEMWDFFREFQNPLVDMAYGEQITVERNYLSPQGDSLVVTGSIKNPSAHPVTVFALFVGLESSHTDSVAMFDDGAHGDGAPGDNLWGGSGSPAGLGEEVYDIDMITHDATLGTRHRLFNGTRFTTAGPIAVEGYTVVSTDTAATPGKVLSYSISLKNRGSTATVNEVTATVRCLDPDVIAQDAQLSFGDMAPGQSSTCSNPVRVLYTPSCPTDHVVSFAVEISSEGILFWEDLFEDYVTDAGETADRVPTEFALEQNYPNPFNPTTVLGYQLPVSSDVRLAVYDLLGREVAVLVNEKKAPGFYRVDFDAAGLASGVYVYRLMAGGTVQIRKMIILR